MELPDDIEEVAADPDRQDEIPYDGLREDCTCGLIGPWAKIDSKHLDSCAIRASTDNTSTPNKPHLNVRLSTRQPIDRDAWEFKLLVNLVTYDAGHVMDSVPEEHKGFLANWLMAHTALCTQLAVIDGLTMHVCPNPQEFVKYFVEQMAHSLAHAIGEAINTRVQGQLKTETHLPANARPTEEKDT